MQMIYNSPNYCVVEFKDIEGSAGGFEIVRGQTSVRVCGDVTASALHLVLDCLASRE